MDDSPLSRLDTHYPLVDNLIHILIWRFMSKSHHVLCSLHLASVSYMQLTTEKKLRSPGGPTWVKCLFAIDNKNYWVPYLVNRNGWYSVTHSLKKPNPCGYLARLNALKFCTSHASCGRRDTVYTSHLVSMVLAFFEVHMVMNKSLCTNIQGCPWSSLYDNWF